MTDIRRYELAPIGLEYLRGEDIGAAKASLDKLVKDLSETITDPTLREDIEALRDGAEVSPEGIAKALSCYGKKYLDAIKDANLGDFWNVYKDEFSDGEKSVYGAKISRFAGVKLKDLEQEIKIKQDKLKNILDNNLAVSNGEVNTLNDELNHYREAYGIIAKAGEVRNSNLKLKVYDDARKEDIKNSKKEMRKIVGV